MYNQGSFMDVIQSLRLEKSRALAQVDLLNSLLEQRDLEISILKKEIEKLSGVISERSYVSSEERREEVLEETPALVSPKKGKKKQGESGAVS